MSTPQKIFLVLHTDITRDDFEHTAMELGFVLYDTRPGDGERHAYEQIWATPDETTAVHYLEDPLVEHNYICLRGAEAEHYATEFGYKLSVEDREDALELAAGAVNHDTQVQSLSRLAITTPEHEPRAFRLFEAYATKPPNPLLREAAVNAMCFAAWPEFMPLLERIAHDDPAPSVREHAQSVLSALRVFCGGAA
jgi:hypothetical protein